MTENAIRWHSCCSDRYHHSDSFLLFLFGRPRGRRPGTQCWNEFESSLHGQYSRQSEQLGRYASLLNMSRTIDNGFTSHTVSLLSYLSSEMYRGMENCGESAIMPELQMYVHVLISTILLVLPRGVRGYTY